LPVLMPKRRSLLTSMLLTRLNGSTWKPLQPSSLTYMTLSPNVKVVISSRIEDGIQKPF
ncbi:hypothetical protein C0991_004839, partial [Blastosporella zonata]